MSSISDINTEKPLPSTHHDIVTQSSYLNKSISHGINNKSQLKNDFNENNEHGDQDAYSRHMNSYLGFRGTSLNNAVCFFAGMGFLLFGYDQGVMSSLLTLKSFRATFKNIDTLRHPENSTLQGAVVAIYEVGCLIGAIATMYVGDKLGRRKTIFFGCIIMIIGAAIQAASYSTGQLIAARVITGIGNGLNTSTVPVWQSECAKPEKRGKLVMLQGSLITCGLMISYWVDFGFYFVDHSSVSWRFPLAFQIIFPLIILPFIMKLPESPRWLLKKGKVDEARRVFSALDDVPLDDPVISRDIEEIRVTLAEELELSNDVKDGARNQVKQMFKQGEARNFHRAMLGYWAQAMQQICGINCISYYAALIFEDYIHMTPLNARILAACNGTEYFLISFVAIYTIETVGRRRLMIFGAIGQCFTMAILCATTWAADPDNGNNSQAGIAAAVFLFVFNSFFAIGWLGMTWLYPAEITPLNIRAAANGLSTSANWSFNFLVVMITPVCFTNIKSFTYLIFCGTNALMIPTVYFLYPETAGRSLEEMDRIFALSNPWTPWDVVKIAKELPYEHKGEDKHGHAVSDSELQKADVDHFDGASDQ